MDTNAHTCTHTHAHTCTHTCTHVHTHMHIYMYNIMIYLVSLGMRRMDECGVVWIGWEPHGGVPLQPVGGRGLCKVENKLLENY